MTRGGGDPAAIAERIARVERTYPATVSRRPKFWSDIEVRRFLIAQLGFLTMREVLAQLAADYEASRVPSRSSVDRFWQHLKKIERWR